MKPLAIMTTATLTALALMLASPVAAYGPTETQRPMPRPNLDCWMDENGDPAGCRVKQ